MALVYSDTKQNRGVIHLSVGGGASTPLPAYTNEKGLPTAAPLVVGILGEETLSLLFEQEAAKRSKNGVEMFRACGRDEGCAPSTCANF